MKPIEPNQKQEEKKSKRRSIKPHNQEAIVLDHVPNANLNEEESEMDKEKRLREESNLRFLRDDERIKQINFDEIVVPYTTDLNHMLQSNKIMTSLKNEIVDKDHFLPGIFLFLFKYQQISRCRLVFF